MTKKEIPPYITKTGETARRKGHVLILVPDYGDDCFIKPLSRAFSYFTPT